MTPGQLFLHLTGMGLIVSALWVPCPPPAPPFFHVQIKPGETYEFRVTPDGEPSKVECTPTAVGASGMPDIAEGYRGLDPLTLNSAPSQLWWPAPVVPEAPKPVVEPRSEPDEGKPALSAQESLAPRVSVPTGPVVPDGAAGADSAKRPRPRPGLLTLNDHIPAPVEILEITEPPPIWAVMSGVMFLLWRKNN